MNKVWLKKKKDLSKRSTTFPTYPSSLSGLLPANVSRKTSIGGGHGPGGGPEPWWHVSPFGQSVGYSEHNSRWVWVVQKHICARYTRKPNATKHMWMISIHALKRGRSRHVYSGDVTVTGSSPLLTRALEMSLWLWCKLAALNVKDMNI